MSKILPAGKAVIFDYTAYDSNSDLYAAMKVFDLTSGTSLLVSTVSMSHVYGGSYIGAYTFNIPGKVYLLHKGIYTDNTYANLIDTYSPGSETVEIGAYDLTQGRAV